MLFSALKFAGTNTAYNNRFGVMAAGRWSNRQQFAIHLQFQQDVINLAVEKSMNICTFNQQQLSADGTRNTATTPSRQRCTQ